MTNVLSSDLLADARKVIDVCRQGGLKIVTVESCTGGLLAGALTSIAGSSEVLERGFVTYSNASKSEQVGVPKSLIDVHGAVSEKGSSLQLCAPYFATIASVSHTTLTRQHMEKLPNLTSNGI